jgi:hypothetical protein
VTDALDEMAPGSNDRYGALVDTIVEHAQALMRDEPADKVSLIDGGGGKYAGVPAVELRRWIEGALSTKTARR